MQLRVLGSNVRCKITNKCLNVREWVEMVEWNKDSPSLFSLSCDSSESPKKTPIENTRTHTHTQYSLIWNLFPTKNATSSPSQYSYIEAATTLKK